MAYPDISHPAYPAATGLLNSGYTSPPPPPLDLNALLANDQTLQGQLTQIGWGLKGPTGFGALATANAPLQNQLNAALIQYGGIPTNVQAADTIRQAAADATAGGFSTLAQRMRAYQMANSASTGSAAARGLGHSGEVGTGLMHNLYNYNVGSATDLANLNATLDSIRASQAANAQTALGQAQTAVANAQQNINQQIASGIIANPRANPPGKQPNTYTPGFPAAPTLRGTNPGTFRQVLGGQPKQYGQPGNRFGIQPGRGRLLLGGGARF